MKDVTDEDRQLVASTLTALSYENPDMEYILGGMSRAMLDVLRHGIEDDCRVCMHAGIFSWNGPPLRELNATSHCRGCHRSWRGVKEAHCTVCHEHFTSAEAADYQWERSGHVHPSSCQRGRGLGPRYVSEETEFGTIWSLARHKK